MEVTKRIVLPGELVSAERKRAGEHVYQQNGKLYADVVGILVERANECGVVPLEGKYVPRENDVVLGIITDEKATGYMVDIRSITPSFISKKDIREPLKPGTVISARIGRVSELKEAELSGVRAYFGGDVLAVTAVKIPRVIGRNGSMLDLLKRGTRAMMAVGRNGWIWAKGGDLALLSDALSRIERRAHVEHLTEEMESYLAEKLKEKGETMAPPREGGSFEESDLLGAQGTSFAPRNDFGRDRGGFGGDRRPRFGDRGGRGGRDRGGRGRGGRDRGRGGRDRGPRRDNRSW